MAKSDELAGAIERLDTRIADLEQRLAMQGSLPLGETLEEGAAIVRGLLTAYAEAHDKTIPETDDLLEVFKAFVKGDPSLNTVRDNVRELVYYQNCLAMGRDDALPKVPDRMVVRTARHIYLYLRTRLEQEGRLD